MVVILAIGIWSVSSLRTQSLGGEGVQGPSGHGSDHKYMPGAESPRALMTRLIEGIAEGDAKQVQSCYELSTKPGELAAETVAELARLGEAAQEALSAAQKKFGKEGVMTLRKEFSFEMQLLEALRQTKADIGRVEIFLNEKGDKAIARVPGWAEEYQLLGRRDGRWYALPSSKEKAAGRDLAVGIFSVISASSRKALEQIPAAVRKSESVAAFRKRVHGIAEAAKDLTHQKKE
jgi:hypothetical protein